jgi:hypothetical protein
MENAYEESWQVVRSLLPERWEERARACGAVARLRGFASPEELLRTLLLHVARGYSLRETVVQAKAAGLAEVSDVALLKRLRKAEVWLRELCLALLVENQVGVSAREPGKVLRLVDATVVKEPGPTGSLWRLHYSLRIPGLGCDFFALTPTEGAGVGESFLRFPVSADDYILGDAGYCTPAGVEHLSRHGAYGLVRFNAGSLPLESLRGRRWAVLPRLHSLAEVGRVGEWPVWVPGPTRRVEGRLCALRKSQQCILQAHRRLRRRASKTGKQVQPATFEYAKYVAVFTTFPREEFTALEVLQWYRVRWQIELVFKRLKSLAQLGHLPKYDESSSRAWLYGKMLVALLTQKLVRIGRAISPWGYPLAAEEPERMARV